MALGILELTGGPQAFAVSPPQPDPTGVHAAHAASSALLARAAQQTEGTPVCCALPPRIVSRPGWSSSSRLLTLVLVAGPVLPATRRKHMKQGITMMKIVMIMKITC